jgi:uncharacterized protein YcnI
MNKLNKLAFAVTGIISMSISGNLFAHASIQVKDTQDEYSGRMYKENSSGLFSLHLSHGCTDATTGKTFATKHASMVFPNAEDLSGIAATFDSAGVEFAGNALMGIKPRVDADWDKIKIKTGTVPTYQNHGANSMDVRGIHWKDGNVPNEMYDNLEVKASFPTLRGCVTKLRVFMPSIQVCENGQVLTWMQHATEAFPDAEGGSAPYIDIVRDQSRNPLPAGCSGGETAEVYPSADDIDKYLPVKRKRSRDHH